MTNATTKTRQRRARGAGKALVSRTAAETSDLAHDLRILSSRLAVTPAPVFWAPGELAARTMWIDVSDDSYDDNYQRALPDWGRAGRISDIHGEGGRWKHYRELKLADELEDIPVYTVTAGAGESWGELPPAREKNMTNYLALTDVPGPDEGAAPPAPSTPASPGECGSGPGTPDDPALD
jgi:hypothetical protein